MEKYDINKVYTQYKEFIASYIELESISKQDNRTKAAISRHE